ncbi:MAG: hypothetical protein SGILL_005927, partial [Bacillariaceae sp.]
MIEEVEREEEEDLDSNDNLGEDGSDIDDDDDSSSSSSLIMPSISGISASKRLSTSQQSKRRRQASEILQQEISILAEEMVPEEAEDILTSLRGGSPAQPFRILSEQREVEIEGQDHVHLQPLQPLELGPDHAFEPLLLEATEEKQNHHTQSSDWTPEECHVYELLKQQQACVKTVKNSEWSPFLHRFLEADPNKTTRGGGLTASALTGSITSSSIHANAINSSSVRSSTASLASSLIRKFPNKHDDIEPHDKFPLNSFVTPTSLLPPQGKKMKAFGSANSYPCGVVFALPEPSELETEEEAMQRTETWAWPAGYAAKTEHNIDYRTGRLINGREEALVSLETLRQHNRDYLEKEDHVIGDKLVKGGFSVIPYNEVFLRVGGTSIQVSGNKENEEPRSFDTGCGMFVAMFVRTATIRDIVALFRTRARVSNILGEQYIKNMPLLYISNENGVQVFSQKLQQQFFNLLASSNPFQDPALEPRMKFDGSNQVCLQQKLEELLDLSSNLREVLTPEACARISGGFGCTDDSVADILTAAKLDDEKSGGKAHRLQDVVVEGMAYAVRSGDYFTARQLLILYTLVSAKKCPLNEDSEPEERHV